MFSVVIPLYNKAHTIKATIQSVLQQHEQGFEVIVVDDGSTDGGADTIRHAFNDRRIRIVKQENQGVSVARNRGVEHARYPYIAFLDGDDLWEKDYLLKMREAIAKFPLAGMFCAGGSVRNADGSTSMRLAKKYYGQTVQIDFFENPHVFLHTSATVITRRSFELAGGFPPGMKRNQDYAFFFSVALRTAVVYCGLPLSVYVGGVQGQATSTPRKEVLNHIVHRFNMVYANWTMLNERTNSFIVFMKYELRHYFRECLRTKDYDSLFYFLQNLDRPVISCFPQAEIKMYGRKPLRSLLIWYILFTKIRWRMRGYPYLGQ